jgi:predicted alpha/beta-fold hydrolase
MKTLGIFAMAIGLGLSLFLLAACNCRAREGEAAVSPQMFSRGQTEEIAYISDIDRMATDVIIYGMTNGISLNGTNYILVVEPRGN